MPEDELICVHDFRDMFQGDGCDRDDPYRVYQAFYCTKCLFIRVKPWDRTRYKLTDEFLEEFEDSGKSSSAA